MVELELGEFLYNLNKDISERINLIHEDSTILKDLEKEYTVWKSQL